MEGRYNRKHWPEYEDLGWNYYGCPTAIDTQSNWRKESSSSGPTDSVLERKWRCSSPVKLVSLCLSLILLALICGIIYLSHLRDQNIRYYTSEGKLTINQAYTSNLQNTNSEEYSLFTYTFCVQMERTFKSNNSPYGSTYQSCAVKNLTPGSIIVTFTLYFLDTITVANEEVISVITSSVRVVNSNTVFGDFIVDTSTLSVTTTLQVYEQDLLPEIKFINQPSTSTTSTASPSTEMVTTSSIKTTEVSTTQTTSTASPSTEMVTTSSTKTTEASTTQTTSTASPSTEMVTTSSTKTEVSTTQKTSTTDAPTSTQSTIVQTTASVLTTDKMTANPATTISTTDEATSMQSTAFQTTSSASTTDKMTSNSLSTITSPTQSLKNETTSAVSKAVENITKISTTEESMSTQLPTVESTQTLSKSSTTIESTTTDLTSKASSTMSNTVQSTLESSTTHKSTSAHLPTVESTVESTSKPLTTVEITTTQLPEVESTSTIPTTTETTPEQSTSSKTTLAPLSTVEAISTNSPMVTRTSSGSNSTESTTMESTEQNSTTSTKEITTQEPLKTVETTSVTPLTVKTTSDSLQTAKISTASSTTAIGTSFISTAPKTTASQTTMIGASTEDSATVISENTSSSLSTVQTTTEVLSTTAVESTPTIQSTSQISISSSTETITTALSSTENSISPSADTTVETKSTSTTETSIMTTPTSDKTTENLLTSTQNVSTTESLTTDIHNTTSTSTFSTYGNTTMYNTTSTPVSPTYVDTTIYNTTTTLDSSTYVNITMYNTTSTTESSTYINTTDYNTTSTTESSLYLNTTIHNATSISASPTYENTTIYNNTSTSDSTAYENTTIYNTTSTPDYSTYVNPTIYNTTSTTESSTFENTTNYNITSSTMLPSTDMSPDYTSLSTTDHTQTTTSSYLSTADVSFPSATVLAKVDITLVCTIKVEDDWSIITAGQELDSDISVLAEYFINGTVSEKTVNDLTTVIFTGDNKTITVAFHIHLSSVAVCPSLLRLTCGIKMMDFAESSITNVSVVHITAPVSNVTLDMSSSFYTGERLELTCRTKTDVEYGDVALEVQFPDGSRLQEPAMRRTYSTARNADCTVDFEWIFKSDFSLEQRMNGSIISCVASNRLLNDTVITSRVLILLTSDVSFAQYYVSGKPGDKVSIACKTNIAAPSRQNISIYKISNNTNVTITTYSNGNITHSPGTTGLGHFQNGTLTVVFTSLQCSNEAQYFCTVTYGSTQITSPLFLTLQPTTTAGSTPVSLSLSVDIVEESFRYTSVHYCSGEIGYPEVNGFLSLTFTNPKTKEAVIYNEKMLLNSTKIIVTTISLNKVILADGLILLIREDVKLSESCSTTHRMRFYLNVTNQWNHGRVNCGIQTEDGPVLSSEKEEVFFVIPANACGDFNGTGTVYIDHEIMDHCNTYIECLENHPPFGSKCVDVDHCAFIGGKSCDDCSRAKCTEVPYTSVLTTPFSTFPTTAGTKGNVYLECTSASVFLKESAHISCNLNISNLLSLIVSKSNSSVLSVQSDGTVTISSSYSGRLSTVFSLSSLTLDITIQSTSCEDEGTYSVMIEFDQTESYITSFTVSLKVKPGTPKLTIHPNLIDGENLMSHACTGEVGHPPGKLEIQIKRPGDTDFSIYIPAGQTRMYSNVGNCSSTQTLDFSIDLSSDSWSNVTARCIALNSVALNSTEIPPSSKEYIVYSIAADFCTNKTSTYFEHHPMGCPFYVWCVTGKPYGMECSTKSLCINTKTGICN